MKRTLLILGAGALLASAAPAVAGHGDKHGHGKGGKHSLHQSNMKHYKDKHSDGRYYAYGRACPPGLHRKNNGCMPPGQLKRLYNRGQRYHVGYGDRWSYNQIPYDLRQRYDFDPNYRYYYGDGYLYQVDPKTLLIQQVVNALLR